MSRYSRGIINNERYYIGELDRMALIRVILPQRKGSY